MARLSINALRICTLARRSSIWNTTVSAVSPVTATTLQKRCVGLIKSYNWTNGGQGEIESIGTERTFSSKYGVHGCPDKSANGMFSYAKSKSSAWGTIDTLPEAPGIALRFDGHVGVYIGGGYAVEERGFNYGCVENEGFLS